MFLPGAVNNRRANVERQPAVRDGESFTSNYRVQEHELIELSTEYDLYRQQQFEVRPNPIKAQQRVEVFLNYLAFGGYYSQTSSTFGIARSTCHLITHEVADFLFNISPRHISLPEARELPALREPIMLANGEVRNAVLFIDGAIVKIQRPDHAGNAYFCGRNGKSCDSLNVQYVVDKNGVVRHVVSGIPGSSHDKTAIEWSNEFMNFLDQLPPNYVVVGDAAYRALHPNVIVPFSGNNLAADQLRYNADLSGLRQIVERTIGGIELKWRMHQLKDNRLPAKKTALFASKCTIAAAVLHNRYSNFLRN